MSEECIVEFVELINYPDYEILNTYPYTIRKKSNHYIIKESLNGSGYVQIHLNNKTIKKHRIIAEQFIPNPDKLSCVDHINHDRSDYHIENLRWCDYSTNNKNQSTHKGVEYNYVDDIDEDAIEVIEYGNHIFIDYYYDQNTDKFYFWNGKQFKELTDCEDNKTGLLYVKMHNTNGKRVSVYYSKFKKLYKLA